VIFLFGSELSKIDKWTYKGMWLGGGVTCFTHREKLTVLRRATGQVFPIWDRLRATLQSRTLGHEQATKPSNNNLLALIDQKLWCLVFISICMEWVAAQPDPWDIPVKLVCEKMQQTHGIVHLGWLDFWLVSHFCNLRTTYGILTRIKSKFAQYALDKLQFCYKK
jgi:hypothetical protein